MTDRGARLTVGTVCTVLVVGLTSCGTPSRVPVAEATASPTPAQPTRTLPPRPMELRLDGVDPCALFTDVQRRQFGVDRIKRDDQSDEFSSRTCLWSNFPNSPDNAWLARAIVQRGAEYALGSSKPHQVVQIEGFPAVQIPGLLIKADHHCVELVDVAPGQTLWVQYVNLRGDLPGISYEVACQKARDGAQAMLKTLRKLKS